MLLRSGLAEPPMTAMVIQFHFAGVPHKRFFIFASHFAERSAAQIIKFRIVKLMSSFRARHNIAGIKFRMRVHDTEDISFITGRLDIFCLPLRTHDIDHIRIYAWLLMGQRSPSRQHFILVRVLRAKS